MQFCATTHLYLIDRNAVALEAVKMTRVQIYSEHRLSKGNGTRTTQGNKASDAEKRRREVTRDKIEELSKYYPLAENQASWRCPALLSKSKHDHNHSAYRCPAYLCTFLVLKDFENLPKPPVNLFES